MKFYKIVALLLAVNNLSPNLAYSDNKSESITYDGMSFEIKNESPYELILTKYAGSDETLNIPECIGDYTVTAIDNEVFKDNEIIKNVTLPDTINYFGSDVFRNSSLVSVNIPKSLRVIPNYSFNNCSELETVIFHDNIILMNNTAFKKTDISVPLELYNTVTDKLIETSNTSCSFYGNEWDYTITSKYSDVHMCIDRYKGNDTELTIPDSINGVNVTEINGSSFKVDPSIKSISFPETITKLTVGFKGSELEKITLPDIDTIPSNTFMDCENLKTIYFQGSPKSFTIGNNAFKNCTNIDYIPCPESCSSIEIGNNAFENTSIKEVKIDFDSSIGTDAFRGCSDLSYVELNNTHVNSRAFRDCSTLENVTISGNSVLEEMSFYCCNTLSSIILSDMNISMINAVDNCPEFMNINNQSAFDNTTGDFNKELKEFIFNNFSGVDDVGFVNLYVQAQAEKIIDKIISDNMTDIQKIKAVHDWICNNTVYDNGTSGDKKNHNDASVLMNDSTVCEGYAKIANILYNTAGIESYYIIGVNHAWNIVKAGNDYFHVDTTWDDGDEISYDWFMKSDDEMKQSGESHSEWKTYIPSSLHSFQKNILPVCKYSLGDLNKDSNVNIADMVLMNKCVLGENIDCDNYIIADLTFDGLVDSFDLVKIRQLLIKQGGNTK